MTKPQTLRIFGILTLILTIAIYLVVTYAPTPSNSFTSAAAVLTFAGGAAVAIERIIETLWILIGGVVGTYWPLNVITKQVNTMVKDLNTALQPFHESLSKELDLASKHKQEVDAQLSLAKAEVDNLKARFDELMKLTPDNQRIQLLTAAAAQNVSYLHQKHSSAFPSLIHASATANAAISGLQDFLATFKDNPGRRLISIYVGAILGLGIAGIYGIDIFAAASNGSPESTRLSVVLTGISIGLGSSPAHEIIRAVQEYKKERKVANTAKPDLPASP